MYSKYKVYITSFRIYTVADIRGVIGVIYPPPRILGVNTPPRILGVITPPPQNLGGNYP